MTPSVTTPLVPSALASKRVLIVTPSFPPMTTPDMQRVRMSLSYYREYGWEPVVLTVDPVDQESAREEALLTTIPDNIIVHRCRALSFKWSRRLGLGNLGLRSWWPLLRAGSKIIRREKIDLVFLSNTQFVTFTLGRIWRRRFGVPYVIDLQDPWRTDYYERPGSRKPPGGWKYQLARLQARLLEGWSFRRMAGFISVSARYLDELRARYPWFGDIPASVIPFGASQVDLSAAQNLPAPQVAPGPNVVRLVYTGAAGPITPHAVNVLFSGLKQFRERHPAEAARLRLEFLGTSYAPADRAKPSIMPLADTHGVADLVRETPARIGHLETLRHQAGADALLLLGSTDAAYSPSKLYPYFLSDKPMLGLVLQCSVLEASLRELSCSFLVTFAEHAATDDARDQLCAFFSAALAGFPAGTLPTRNKELFRREYLAPALTARQCALFDQAVAHDKR